MSPSLTNSPEPPPFLSVAETARRAGMSPSNIRRKCAKEGLGFKPGGNSKADWLIRPDTLARWLAGEKLK